MTRHAIQLNSVASRRRGGMIVLIAVCLPIFLACAAFAVNVAYIDLTRTELRTATDFAARAAGRTLSATGDQTAAIAMAQQAASRNEVAGAPLQLDNSDIEFGFADRANENQRYLYTAGNVGANSVRVTGLLSSVSLNGLRALPFANAFDRSQFGAQQRAIATQVDRDICIVIDRSGSMAFGVTETATGTPSSAPSDWSWCDGVPPNFALGGSGCGSSNVFCKSSIRRHRPSL